MEDPRRRCILGSADARLGNIWLSDWGAAHSPWADHFDLIVNCTHKEGRYRRRNVGFWMEMGLNMDVPTLQQAVKKVLRAMLEERDTLVHCKQGKHRSGCFLMFVNAVIDDGIDVEVWLDDYLKHSILRPHDRGCVLRAWRESGLSKLLGATRRDAEVQGLVAEIHARVDESGRQGVEGSRREQRGSEGETTTIMIGSGGRRGVEGSRGEHRGRKRPEQRGRKRPSESQSQPEKPVSSGDVEVQGPVAKIHARVDESTPRLPDATTMIGSGCLRGVEGSRGEQRGRKRPSESQSQPEKPASSGSSSSLQGRGVEGSAGPQPSFSTYKYKPGDWQCYGCGNWNYAYRQQCNFRHCPRAYWKRGDWTCDVCGNHNYASRTQCAIRTCQAPKP